MQGTITPKGWSEFQHYKDRKPAWVKLHRDLLDNYDFHCLPIASKALAPCLWLLASEYEGGHIPADFGMIAFRLRMTEKDVEQALSALIEKGFFIASKLLADCYQNSILEKEKERETEKESPITPKGGNPAGKPKRAKREETTLTDWLTALPEDQEPILADDPLLIELDAAGVPAEYVELAWAVFVRDWGAKKAKDWPATFRNAIRKGWIRLWYFDQSTGECRLSSTGELARRSLSHG